MSFYGTDLEKSTSFAVDSFSKSQNLNTTFGHVEALQALTLCEIMAANITNIERNIAVFQSFSRTLDNPSAKVWEACARVRKFPLGALLLEADEYNQVNKGLTLVRSVTQSPEGKGSSEKTKEALVLCLPKVTQLDAYATEAQAVLIIGESDYVNVSYEIAKKGLEIMKSDCKAIISYTKDSFIIVTTTLLYLYKELLDPETSGPNESLRASVLSSFREALACCESLSKAFPLCKQVVFALSEAEKVASGKQAAKKASEKLESTKLLVGKFCKNDAIIIENVAADMQAFAPQA